MRKRFNKDHFKEIRQPKEPQRNCYPIQVPEGTPGENVGVPAPFVQCMTCAKWYHWACAMYNDKLMASEMAGQWTCGECEGRGKVADERYRAKTMDKCGLSNHIENYINKVFKSRGISHNPVVVRVLSALKCKHYTPASIRERWGEGQL